MSPHDKRWWVGILAGLVVLSALSASGIAYQQNDQYPQNCGDAPLVNSTSIQRGVINTPNDQDSFRVRIKNRGSFIVASPKVSDAEAYFKARFQKTKGKYTALNATGENAGVGGWGMNYGLNEEERNVSIELWAEKDDTEICIKVREGKPDKARIPYEWNFRLQKDKHQVAVVESRIDQLEAQLVEQNETINSLQQQVQTQNETIARLQEKLESNQSSIAHERLEEKNQTIAQLKEQLEQKTDKIESLRKQLQKQKEAIEQAKKILQNATGNTTQTD